MHSWHIKQVFLNGANLYDHDQTHIYNTIVCALNCRVHVGVRSYETFREKKEPNLLPKKEFLLIRQSIVEMSTKSCYQKKCM